MLVFGINTTFEYRFCLAQKVGGGIFFIVELKVYFHRLEIKTHEIVV